MRNLMMIFAALMILLFSSLGSGEETVPTCFNEEWNEKIKGDVEEAVRLSSTDPVSSLLTFKSVMERKKDGPTQRQIIWLSEKVDSLREPVRKTLQADFDQAAHDYDLRSALITSYVANKIGKEFIKIQPVMTELMNKAFVGSSEITSVWEVTNVVGEFIEPPYREGSSFNRLTITPKEGFRLLRVTGSVRNISSLVDKQYTLWAIEDIKRSLVDSTSAKKNEHEYPYLWLDKTFISLLTPASDMIPCRHVCAGCDLRSSLRLTVSSKDGTGGRVINLPKSVDFGQNVNFDLLFSVPEEIAEYRLLILGAKPIDFKIIAPGDERPATKPAGDSVEEFSHSKLVVPMTIPGLGQIRVWMVWVKRLQFTDLDPNKEIQLVLSNGRKITRRAWLSESAMLFFHANPSYDAPPIKLLYKDRVVALAKPDYTNSKQPISAE